VNFIPCFAADSDRGPATITTAPDLRSVRERIGPNRRISRVRHGVLYRWRVAGLPLESLGVTTHVLP
jgi:hypothetical protein